MKKFPLYGLAGIILVIIFWYLNWNLTGLRTNLLFFPLWFGYILTIDSINFYKNKTSLLSRNRKKFFQLFFISAPAWWFFELINWRTQNWFYDGRQYFTDFEYAILATISFSTVMPAVFETSELISSFKWIGKFKIKKPVIINNNLLIKLFLLGLFMLGLILIFPKYFYYFEWSAVYFILEPINYKLNNKTLLESLFKGNWRPFIILSIGALICGFFWEMWNFYSYPKWIYNTPMVNFLHIFEMPLPGYIGYIPFAWELFAIYNFVTGTVLKERAGFLEIG